MEGALAKVSGKLVSLSEQNLVDCATTTHGCNGGWPFEAFDWIIENGGINAEIDYPFKGREMSCNIDKNKPIYKIKDWYAVVSQDEAHLTEMIATEGPISVVIDAGPNFQHYGHGVYYEPSCSSTKLNHAVLVVGYGNEYGQDFYWVKNNWGKHWGDHGYIKMSRNRNNNCGITTIATWPIGERNDGTRVFSFVTALPLILVCVQYTMCWSKWGM
jgi:C1A family cysteine protease